jgi:Pyruvate/2-oxoacid:ferredoxin oxidoreductase delta subunit
MNDDVYFKLREFLDNLPGGYPATDSGVEIKILKKLFTSEQAHIALHLKQKPEPTFLIARRLKMKRAELAEKLEVMAKEGLIYRVRLAGRPLYMALQFIVGIFEFHLNTLDRELAELVEEYLPYIAKSWEGIKTNQLRVVPVESSISTAPAISTYNDIRTLLKKKKLLAVAPCICQKESSLLGKECTRTPERCLVFDQAAQHYIENGLGRQISRQELDDILARGEQEALVLSPTNAKDIANICMCCGCCCGILRLYKSFPKPAEHVQSAYQACIDPDLCTVCGMCLERCQMEAINEREETFEVDLERCIGCGLCVSACPADAISMVAKPEPAPLPKDFFAQQKQIARERGLR